LAAFARIEMSMLELLEGPRLKPCMGEWLGRANCEYE
jgi:hypothetical protein